MGIVTGQPPNLELSEHRAQLSSSLTVAELSPTSKNNTAYSNRSSFQSVGTEGGNPFVWVKN